MTIVRALWGVMALLLFTGFVIFSIWGIPAPSIRVEKVLPNDRLPQ